MKKFLTDHWISLLSIAVSLTAICVAIRCIAAR